MKKSTYLTTEKPNSHQKIYYCPQPLLYILFSPLMKTDRFDSYISEKLGNEYLTFYTARNGIYHILKYLRQNFGSQKIFLPDKIHPPTKTSPAKSWSVIVACKEANYQIVYFDDEKGPPNNLKKNDVVLLLDNHLKLPSFVFSIEDNANNALMPTYDYDFTVYSFAIGKPLPSPRGGIVVVNSKRLKGFLKVQQSLVPPDIRTEINNYFRYLVFYKIKNYPLVRSIMHWEYLHLLIKGSDFTGDKVVQKIIPCAQYLKKLSPSC